MSAAGTGRDTPTCNVTSGLKRATKGPRNTFLVNYALVVSCVLVSRLPALFSSALFGAHTLGGPNVAIHKLGTTRLGALSGLIAHHSAPEHAIYARDQHARNHRALLPQSNSHGLGDQGGRLG
jgi:hypothetical protein